MRGCLKVNDRFLCSAAGCVGSGVLACHAGHATPYVRNEFFTVMAGVAT